MRDFSGFIYGGEVADRDAYITLEQFPIPVFTGKGGAVYIMRKPLHICRSTYNIPRFESQEDLDEWFAHANQLGLTEALKEFALHFSTSDSAKSAAADEVRVIFGLY